MKSAESYELLSAISALDRRGRRMGYRPLDPRDASTPPAINADSVKLLGRVSLGFAAGDVYSVVSAPGSGEAFALSTQAFALAGSMGPLPLPIAEELLLRASQGDQAGIDFLDLFHARLLRLFYLIRKRSRPALGAARGSQTAQARMVRSLTHLPESQWLRHAGLQSGAPQSAASLQQLLAERLRSGVSVSGLQGRWHPIRQAGVRALAGRPKLGENATLGQHYWSPNGGLRVQTPPLPARDVRSWLPGGDRYVMLTGLLTTVLQKAMTLQLVVTPDGGSIAPAQLSRHADLRLGQNTWIKTRPDTTALPCAHLLLQGMPS
ncbi:MAG: hypothetical protein RLY30_553 [Pseudomonadota bacterium]